MSLGMMLNLPQSRSASTAATMVPSPAGGCQESSWVSTGDGRDMCGRGNHPSTWVSLQPQAHRDQPKAAKFTQAQSVEMMQSDIHHQNQNSFKYQNYGLVLAII